jgi:L-ascorbate metabolism protein UlaG (beta-lactamase superfamily)/rhodanese-related sulfurtransferase
MKKIISCLLALLGLNTACGQQPYTDMNVDEFDNLIAQPDVQLLDVRSQAEYDEGHIAGSRLADVKLDGFIEKASAMLDTSRTVAVYCRSGRRSASAAKQLAAHGYKVVNLQGGILAWQSQGMPVTTEATSPMSWDVFTTPGGKRVEVLPLMHASLSLVIDGRQVYVDPVSELGERIVHYNTMPKADLLLVTHEHFDHLDKAALATLSSEGTQLVTNQRCADQLGYGHVMSNGDVTDIDGLHIEAVPAYNTTEGHTQFHPKGRDNGFVLTYDGLRIYIAGDTEDIPEMANLKDIDIAFLPCNQPYTMTVDQLLHAARMFKPRVVYPYHYSKTDISQLPQLLKNDGIEARLRKWE